MRFFTLIISLIALGSLANAGPGMSRMSSLSLMKEINTNKSKSIVRRAKTMHKRNYMQGYKPKEQASPQFQYDNIMNKKITFVDKNHERFVIQGKQQSLKEGSSIIEKKDDHTLVVKLKKN